MFECMKIVEEINEGVVKNLFKTGEDTNRASHIRTTRV